MSLSEQIQGMVHAFSDAERKDAVRNIASGVATLERENATQKSALAKSASALSAFPGFHAEALPLEAVRGLSELLKEIQPLISPPNFTCAEPPAS